MKRRRHEGRLDRGPGMKGCHEMSDFGAWTLLPTAIVFTLAMASRRPIESLLAGAIFGLIMLNGWGFAPPFAEVSLRVMTDESVAWIFLVCGFMGSLIALLMKSGAMNAFIHAAERAIRSRASALFVTWGLGVALFVDDYLNSMAVGATMQKITDKYRVSRDMLAYVVDSTAAPASVLVPISTWAVFFGVLLETNDVAAEGSGVLTYIQSIPYMLYPWFAILLVPLVIFGIVPVFGPMKEAERRAAASAAAASEIAAPSADADVVFDLEPEHDGPMSDARQTLLTWILIVSMASLVGFTIYFDLDFLTGIYCALGVTIALLVATRSMAPAKVTRNSIGGFIWMIEPMAIIFAAFALKDVNDQLGMPQYVIGLVEPYMTAQSLPVIAFVTMAALSFTTGSNWGIFVITVPIVVALARAVDADMTLVIGATLSASTFGSHACFYSDATVLTAQATGTTPMRHAFTQLPYAMIAAAAAAIGFAALGYAMG